MESDTDSFGRREWVFIILILISVFLAGTQESIQAPLFPPEAQKKGVDATIYASILGFTTLTAFLTIPVTSALLLRQRLDLRLCFLGFSFSRAIFIFYGLLDLNSHTVFIVLGYLWHAIEGIGFGGIISLPVFVCLVFPKRVATLTGLISPALAIGGALGPIFGEAIFEFGGYTTAMISAGVIYLLIAVFLCIILPEVPKLPQVTSAKIILEYFRKVLSISTGIYSFGMLVNTFGTSYLYAILEPHLEQFKLTHMQIGFVFACSSVPQLLSPLIGYVADRTGHGALISFLGGVVGVLGIAGVGPITILPLNASVALTAVGLVLFGIGQGALSSCNFANIVTSTRDIEIPGGNNFTRVIFVCIFQVMSSTLGSFLGYSVAGGISDVYGYENAINILFGIYGFMSLLLLYQTIVTRTYNRRRSVLSTLVHDPDEYTKMLETSPLLSKT